MKKVIAVMAALMVAAVLFNINVSADNRSFELKYIQLVYDYANGDISYDEFCSLSSQYVEEFGSDLMDMSGITLALEIEDKIRDTVVKFGENAGEVIGDWLDNAFNDYETQEEVSTTDKKGYQSVYVKTTKSSSSNGKTIKEYTYFNGYIICYPKDTGYNSYKAVLDDGTCYYAKYSDGVLDDDVSGYQTEWSDFQSTETSKVDITVYGDVRYSDGSSAPTDDEYTTQDTLDLTGLSDSELDELLEDINEELERQNPDLTSIEGLLTSIYYRLGALDSDNDNALLSDINTAILSLAGDSSNEEMVKILLEIRDELKNEDNGTADDDNTDENGGEIGDSSETSDGHPDHICGTLYNVKPLDKNWLNKLFTNVTELKVEYQGSNYYLESCGCLLLDDKYYSVDMNYDSYSTVDYDFSNDDISLSDSISLKDGVSLEDIDFGSAYDIEIYSKENVEVVTPLNSSVYSTPLLNSVVSEQNFLSSYLTEGQTKKIEWVCDIIDHFITLGIPYESITNSMYMFEGIIFNDYTPEDLTFNVFDTNVTILSYSWFCPASDSIYDDYDFKECLDIVRLFSSIIIGFAWVLTMRKKIVSML